MKKAAIYQLFSKIPPIETPRLLLRAMKVTDAADMFDYARREDVTRYLTWTPHPDVGYTREYLTYVGQRYRTGDFFDWSILHTESGRMIGTCGFTRFDFSSDSAEIGYVLHPDYRGRGLATEAVNAVISFGFERLKLHRIEAKYIRGNEASRRLMERVGMEFEGYARESMKIKGVYQTVGTCAMLAEDHQKIKAASAHDAYMPK